jgi:ferredoxin-NADP reductase
LRLGVTGGLMQNDSQCLRVVAVHDRADQIKSFVLRHADGARLPGYAPGAHVRLRLPLAAGAVWRAYSLVRPASGEGADSYEICVRHEPAGAGGSAYMHQMVAPGSLLEVSTPMNAFALQQDASAHRLVAGGIGITPLLCMAMALAARGSDVSLCYFARSRQAMAYLDELQALPGLRLKVHATADPDEVRAALANALAHPGADERMYVCGPAGLMTAATEVAAVHGWAPGRVHQEAFSAATVESSPFSVRLLRTGLHFEVGPRESLLDALIGRLGERVAHDCRVGVCGACLVPVAAGPIDHRDSFLTNEDRTEGTLMCACVSRAPAGALLELDL